MTSTQQPRRQAARTIGQRRALARQLACDLTDVEYHPGSGWPDAAISLPADWPEAPQTLTEIRQATAEATRTPGATMIAYHPATGDSVIIIHARDWSLVFAAEGRCGTAATIYLVADTSDGPFPFVLEHDSRRVVEVSHLFHETFGSAARCWD